MILLHGQPVNICLEILCHWYVWLCYSKSSMQLKEMCTVHKKTHFAASISFSMYSLVCFCFVWLWFLADLCGYCTKFFNVCTLKTEEAVTAVGRVMMHSEDKIKFSLKYKNCVHCNHRAVYMYSDSFILQKFYN